MKRRIQSPELKTDPWGIDNGYFNTQDQWQPTDPDTHRAILAAMGAEDAASCPPTQGTAANGPVRVVQAGAAIPWASAGELQIEEGGRIEVAETLPANLPLGYHTFIPAKGGDVTRVIVAPSQCVAPTRHWGWSVQLYAARSRQSWGIGDLGDLQRLARWSAGLGAGSMLVNPLSAPAPTLPQQASPYYPSSRRFRNPIYLRVEEIPGAAELGSVVEQAAAKGRALNCDRRIHRDEVFRLKQGVLRQLWDGFHGDPEFTRFCAERDSELTPFAAYCALVVQHGGVWRQWPAEYRDPRSQAVADFVNANRREVDYHKWLQWHLDRQLAAASRELPLVHDLPVGVDPGGADAWIWQDLLASDCTVGAPPDVFNPAGQDWSLPPLTPHKLRAAAYDPFIQTVRASLRHAGGLRIDHVMSLFRLYWIPKGFGPARGTYVRYPADDLLSIVALESHRAGAFVVGEDLGTVEPGMRDQLADYRALSFRLLWFEKKLPAAYPAMAMAAISTHDLPTIAGLWTGRDAEAQQAIGVGDPKAMAELREHLVKLVGLPADAPIEAVIEKTHRLLGQAPSAVLLATLDDAMAVEERPNMPGTIDAWPNWSIALPKPLESLEEDELPRRIAAALSRSESVS
jgi:4-alpha-glucanotransferase